MGTDRWLPTERLRRRTELIVRLIGGVSSMQNSHLPGDVARLVDETLDSVELLDVMLLLWRRSLESWTGAEVASELRTNPRSAERRSKKLANAGLLREYADGSFRYAPCDATVDVTVDTRRGSRSLRGGARRAIRTLRGIRSLPHCRDPARDRSRTLEDSAGRAEHDTSRGGYRSIPREPRAPTHTASYALRGWDCARRSVSTRGIPMPAASPRGSVRTA